MMGTNYERKSCVKCQKVVKSTEKVLVCGLWCKKSFHNDCVGLTHSETRVVTCSNERIKFHCETCENRLGVELVGEKETHEPDKLQNCVNNSLLELVQKILKLINELSNNDSVINKKLDTVISSNTRLEEYILQSPKCLEKRSEETIDNSVEYVESFSTKRAVEIGEENDTNLDNTNLNSASMSQQTDDNSSSLHTASDVPEQLPDNQEPLVAEERSSNEWEVPGHQNHLHDPLSTNKEERIPLEDLVRSEFSIAKTECEGGEEKADIDINKEECSSSEDLLECSTFSIEKIEHGVDGEAVREDVLEELKHEVESAASDNGPERTIAIGMDDNRNKDDSKNLVTEVSQTAGKGYRIQCTTKQEVSGGNNKTLKQKTTRKQDTQLHSGERPFSCSVCNKTFTLKTTLQRHSRLHSGERPFSCSVCNKTFTRKTTLKMHSQLHSGERPFSCSVCNKKFIQKTSLKHHLMLHSGERPFSCSVCNKTFTLKTTLQQHSRLHSGDRPFSCSVCNKTFTRKTTLKMHSQLHSGERPFSCSVCNKTFIRKTTLKMHSQLHSGERPFSCSVCNKTFKQKRILKQHSMVHSGERPFSCSVCNKKFTQKSSLKHHLMLHSGERPFSCSVCNKSFTQKITLQRHSRLHFFELPLNCSVGNKTFRYKAQMKNYLRL